MSRSDHRIDSTVDLERMSQILAGAQYPAAKWQLIMHAEEHGADGRTRAELWALPAGSYKDLPAVLAALLAVPGRRDGDTENARPAEQRPLHLVPGRLRPVR
ncbi:MAG: DUF2795 domain-containing protein [Pseudonocardia sp.]